MIGVLCAALFIGCSVSAKAPNPERRIALPQGSVDLAALDADLIAVLVQTGRRKSVVIVRRATGDELSRFDVAPDAVSVASGGSDYILVLNARAQHAALMRYSVGGAQLVRVALEGDGVRVAGRGAHSAYVLLRHAKSATVDVVDMGRARVSRTMAAPPNAVSLSASERSPDGTLLAADANGSIFEGSPLTNGWKRLSAAFGQEPVLATSGRALYALQQFSGATFVQVVALPYALPVRLFPVARDTARMTEAPDHTLLILERSGSTFAVRTLSCRSPLLAVTPFTGKHGHYYDEGTYPGAAATFGPVRPLPTGDEC